MGESSRHRVAAEDINHGNRQRLSCKFRYRSSLRDDQLDTGFYQLCSQAGHSIRSIIAKAIIDEEVVALDIPQISKSLTQSCQIWREARLPLRCQPADPDVPWLVLRDSGLRQSGSRSGNDQKPAPVH